jgi:hypothetical protein
MNEAGNALARVVHVLICNPGTFRIARENRS